MQLDVLINICLRLDNQDIRSLSLASQKMLETTKKIYASQVFWFLRIQHYTRCELKNFREKIVCWRNVYTCLTSLRSKWKSSSDRQANEMAALIHIKTEVYNTRIMLDIACSYGYVEVMKKLLSNPDTFISNKNLHMACRKDRLKIVRLILGSKKIDPRVNLSCELVQACTYNKVEMARLLLEDGRVDPTCLNNHCMSIAAYYGHTEIVRLLLADRRVNPVYISGNTIRVASRGNSLVRVLHSRIAVDSQGRGSYALAIASEQGHIKTVELLLADGRSGTVRSEPVRRTHDRIEVLQFPLHDPRANEETRSTYNPDSTTWMLLAIVVGISLYIILPE